MEKNQNNQKIKGFSRLTSITVLFLLVLILLPVSVYAWFSITGKEVAGYIPVASPHSLSIGAGHVEIDNSGFIEEYEDIRYLYISGIDVKSSEYRDYVFCIYGKAVPRFKIQIGYTTNNQFDYAIFNASESTIDSSGIEYITHSSTPTTYYYSISGSAISGTYRNRVIVSSEALATSSSISSTYGLYTEVNKYANPVYWLSNDINTGTSRGSFVKYFILRVYTNGKEINDKETDIICIVAKSS